MSMRSFFGYVKMDVFEYARKGDSEGMKQLLINMEASESYTVNQLIYKYNERGNTFMHEACCYGNKSIVSYLLSIDETTVDVANSVTGNTPLMLAAACGHDAIVSMLLSHCKLIDVNKQNSSDRTCLMLGCASGSISIVSQILTSFDCSSIINQKSFDDETALSIVCKRKYRDIAMLLIKYGAVGYDVASPFGYSSRHIYDYLPYYKTEIAAYECTVRRQSYVDFLQFLLISVDAHCMKCSSISIITVFEHLGSLILVYI